MILPANPGQLDALAAFEEAFAPKERWSAAAWADEIEADNREVWVSTDPAGGVRGVVSVQVVGPMADLNRIVVAPGARREGLGAALLERAVAAARCRGAEELLLEVRADNAPARALYDRAGFVEIARRAGYYLGTDAVVMRKELS